MRTERASEAKRGEARRGEAIVTLTAAPSHLELRVGGGGGDTRLMAMSTRREQGIVDEQRLPDLGGTGEATLTTASATSNTTTIPRHRPEPPKTTPSPARLSPGHRRPNISYIPDGAAQAHILRPNLR